MGVLVMVRRVAGTQTLPLTILTINTAKPKGSCRIVTGVVHAVTAFCYAMVEVGTSITWNTIDKFLKPSMKPLNMADKRQNVVL